MRPHMKSRPAQAIIASLCFARYERSMQNILLIDNYDSFTYNLLHYLGEAGAEVAVVRNDRLDIAALEKQPPQGIVISPGPGSPEDSGLCPELIRRFGEKVPLLGVCLGHQTIGAVFGGEVVRAPEPMHGKTSLIHHTGESVFTGLPSPFTATRYHSLIVRRETLPACLRVTAWTEDGLVMGMRHREFPLHGVQFHPESIASEHGHALIRNFLGMI
jgi:anthranilate synthase component 2